MQVVLVLLRYFYQLAILRRGPQDLPAAPVLLGLALAANLLVGVVGSVAWFGGLWRALLGNLLDAGLVAMLLWAVLRWRGKPERWQQTLTAVWGLGAIFAALLVLLDLLRGGAPVDSAAAVPDLLLLIWLHVAVGSVFRHALDIALGAGIALALMFSVLGMTMIGAVLPPAAN